MLQGQKDMLTVGKLILSELAPVVSAQHGVFYVMETPKEESVEEPSPEVRAVAELLRGREVVLIGGVERPTSARGSCDRLRARVTPVSFLPPKLLRPPYVPLTPCCFPAPSFCKSSDPASKGAVRAHESVTRRPRPSCRRA